MATFDTIWPPFLNPATKLRLPLSDISKNCRRIIPKRSHPRPGWYVQRSWAHNRRGYQLAGHQRTADSETGAGRCLEQPASAVTGTGRHYPEWRQRLSVCFEHSEPQQPVRLYVAPPHAREPGPRSLRCSLPKTARVQSNAPRRFFFYIHYEFVIPVKTDIQVNTLNSGPRSATG